MTSVGLREQKKTQTRQLIADAAAELFGRLGYDAVTVEDVAAAAQVSKKTVFNYFPTKEDLVFVRADDRAAALLAAARDRAPDITLLDGFRRLCLDQTRLIARMRDDSSRGFHDLVAANPALQRRAHEINARLTALLAGALAEQTGLPAQDPLLTVVAGTLVEAQRTLYRALRERVVAGGEDAVIARAHRRDVHRVFDQLQAGLGDLPRRRPRSRQAH